MKKILYLNNTKQLNIYSPNEVEFIWAPKEFNRRGLYHLTDSLELVDHAVKKGFHLALEWDALIEEKDFLATSHLIKSYISLVHSIRLRDAGAIIWARDNTSLPLELLLEAGHHNLKAIESWKIRLNSRLKKIVVSSELPQSTLKKWKSSLVGIEMEILVLGPLLLFHSPRHLLKRIAQNPLEEIHATGASEESPHKGFGLTENKHGTLMFHPKDISLLDRWNEVEKLNLDVVRFDTRQEKFDDIDSVLSDFFSNPMDLTLLKRAWSKDWMRGYWDVNKSDILFDKLTNTYLSSRDEDFVGHVVENKKESWLAIEVKNQSVNLNDQLEIVSPTGKKKEINIRWLKNEFFDEVLELKNGQFGFIPWCSSAPYKSLVKKRN